MKKLLLANIMLLLCVCVHAQHIDTLTLDISFRTNEYIINDRFDGNGDKVAAFVQRINAVLADPNLLVYDVSIYAGASPEGNEETNVRLSNARAGSIRERLLFDTKLTANQIRLSAIGSDWFGLVSLIEETDYEWKNDAINIIKNKYSSPEVKKEELKILANGAMWKWAMREAFPTICQHTGFVQCIIIDRKTWGMMHGSLDVALRNGESKVDTIYVSSKDTVYYYMNRRGLTNRKEPKNYHKESLLRPAVFAFHTNLLLPLLNAGFDVPLGNRVSLGADVYYPWAIRPLTNTVMGVDNEYCLQGLGGFLECRFWPGSRHKATADPKYRLCGHSVAVVIGAGMYDYEYPYAGSNEPYGSIIPVAKGRQGEAYTAGVDYAYFLAAGKKAGVRISFNVTIGYMYSEYYSYGVYDNNRSQGIIEDALGTKESMWWVGPVRAGINLVVPIHSKGGRR